jgi:peptide/nickel transport system substrate-binding protein
MHRSRTRRSVTALLATAGAAAIALSGCAAGGGESGADRPLRVWAGSTTPIPENFNPFAVGTAVHATYGAIYEPLFFFNQLSADEPEGLIGESFEFSEDGRVITIAIKPDLVWNDGEPLTAEDVAFTFQYGPNVDAQFVSAEVQDETTVVLTYSEPKFTAASLILGSTWIVPQHVWEGIEDYAAETNTEPVGSGPYTVKSFTDATYTVEANELYRDGAPAVKEVQYLGLDSNQSSQDLLTTGRIDWVGQFIANPDSVTGSGSITMLNQQQNPTVIITCSNTELGCEGPQTDPAVRQALDLAIDRGSINERAFAGLAGASTPSFTLQPRDEQWLADPSLAESPQTADVDAATGVLEDAGYTLGSDGVYEKDGQKVEIDLFSPDGWTDYNDTVKLIAEQAAEAGIAINGRTVSDAEYWTPIGAGQFQTALWGLTQSLVADPFSNYDQYFWSESTAPVGEQPVSGQNYARYVNPEIDAAVEAAAATDDEAIKQEAYATIQEDIARDLPYIPVVLNASQAFYNTAAFTGWPTDGDLYAAPLPYLATANARVLVALEPTE